VLLAIDVESRKVSKLVIERFRTKNRVEVCTIRRLRRPRPSRQHASVVIKVATKEDAKKLLKLDSVTFSKGRIIVSLFKEQRTLVACFKCRRFRHRVRDYMQLETCNMCS
jgi:hypothetical protein